jgi:hypothetical protein
MKITHNSALIALTAAACLLPSLGKKAQADTLGAKTTLDITHSNYRESDLPASKLAGGAATRYDIAINQIKFKTNIASDTEMSLSGVQETMSGASAWYVQPDANGALLQVMSGATIDEKRNEINIDFHTVNEYSESSLAFSHSSERDYRSYGLSVSGALHVYHKLTTLDYGVNYAKDYIDATDADIYLSRPTGETKDRFGLVLGASHVVTKNTLIGISVSYAALNGYLSDPYKLALVAGETEHDARPDVNGQFASALRLREFIPQLNAALHVGYRYYNSNWGITSDTLEISWYQNLGRGWQIIPSFRYYQQISAEFYQPFYSAKRVDGYYSSDYRLSEFSAKSSQLKLLKNFNSFYVNVSYENYTATGDNPALISYAFYTLGAGITF